MYICSMKSNPSMLRINEIHSCPELMDYISEIGFLPLLNLGVVGWSADEAVDEDCGYHTFPDGGYEWQLWDWKGQIIQEMHCAYGKFFDRKAAFISREWWPDFCNHRRSRQPYPAENSIEYGILATLREGGSMISRDLRRACGMTGPRMRGRFDSYVARLQMEGYIVTEDFVYPEDSHGRQYGWGWSLLTTPEQLFGRELCHPDRTAEESYRRLKTQLASILPQASDKVLSRLLR